MNGQPIDDVDRLFSRLSPAEPPADFLARVMSSAKQTSPRSPAISPWLLVDLVAAFVLAWAAFDFGQILAEGAWAEAIGNLYFDADLIVAAPSDWILAISEVTPFISLVGMFVAGAAVAVATHKLIESSRHPSLRVA